MLLKCYTQYASKLVKLSSDHRTGKSEFSSQSQRRAAPQNVQTTGQLYSFHMLVRLCSKLFKLCFSSIWNKNFQIYKLGLKKAEEPNIKLTTVANHRKSKRSPEGTPISASLTIWNPLTVRITTNCGKFLKKWEYQTNLLVSWETCLWVKKQQSLTWNN